MIDKLLGVFGPQTLAIIIVALLGVIGWQYVTIAGYKVANAESDKAVAALATEISVKDANLVALQDTIQRQNASIELAAKEAASKRAAALAARDKAVADLEAVRGDYTKLRKAWPKECVAAVSMVRKELGLLCANKAC